MNGLGRQSGPSHQRAPARRDRIGLDVGAIVVGKAMACGQMVGAFLEPKYERTFGRAQPGRRLDQRVEHGLQVEGRAADDLEHIGGGGMLLQRFAQLVEQPCILDGDDGLVGESRDQLDLFRSKWLRDGFCYEDNPYDNSLAQERGAERSSVAANLLSVTPGIFRVRQHVGNVNHSCLLRGSSSDTASLYRD